MKLNFLPRSLIWEIVKFFTRPVNINQDLCDKTCPGLKLQGW